MLRSLLILFLLLKILRKLLARKEYNKKVYHNYSTNIFNFNYFLIEIIVFIYIVHFQLNLLTIYSNCEYTFPNLKLIYITSNLES